MMNVQQSGHHLTLTFDIVACERGTSAWSIPKQKPPAISAAISQAKSHHGGASPRSYSFVKDAKDAVSPTVCSGVPTECVEEATARLVTAIRAYGSSASGGKPLGIVLSHRYIGNEPSLDGLKGVDRVVAQAIAASWRVKLLPVLVRRHVISKAYGFNASCSAEVIAYTPADACYALDPDSSPRPEALPEHVFIDTVEGRTLNKKHDSGSSYTGNQAAPETLCGLYFSVALLIGAPLSGP
jgi:hypothetical protein